MSRVPGRDTAPELAVRRAVHALGLRYFVDRAPLPGLRRRADLVFPRLRVAVFVDRCFWHGCPAHGNSPRHNGDWWREKIARNQRRDRDTDALLGGAGWTVVRVWEHDDPVAVAQDVARCVAAASRRRPDRRCFKVTALRVDHCGSFVRCG